MKKAKTDFPQSKAAK